MKNVALAVKGETASRAARSLAFSCGPRLREDLVLVESKSEDGDGPADRIPAELGQEPIALSQYRTGIDLLVARGPCRGQRAAAALVHLTPGVSGSRRGL